MRHLFQMVTLSILFVLAACGQPSTITNHLDKSNDAAVAIKEQVEQLPAVPTNTNDERVFKATVERVIDADTIVISGDRTVRILNINAPESTKKIEKFGPESAKFARQLLKGKTVQVELSQKAEPVDKYDRTLAFIRLEDGRLYEEVILKEGLARIAYLFPPDDQTYLTELKKAEQLAKEAKKGIWSIEGYVDGENGYDMSAIQ